VLEKQFPLIRLQDKIGVFEKCNQVVVGGVAV